MNILQHHLNYTTADINLNVSSNYVNTSLQAELQWFSLVHCPVLANKSSV